MNRIDGSSFRFSERGAARGKAKQTAINTIAAMERMELYCMAHPGSPSAVRRPRLLIRGEVWIALLGASIEEGIAGFGNIVEAALRAFDAQYLRGLRSPENPSDSSSTGVRERTPAAEPASRRFSPNARPVRVTAAP